MNIYNIIQGIYMIYIFNYFETSYSWQTENNLNIQSKTLIPTWLLHPTHTNVSSKICPLGNVIGWVYGLFLILRPVFGHHINIHYINILSLIIIVAIMIGGYFLNFNVVVYSVPIFISELLRL